MDTSLFREVFQRSRDRGIIFAGSTEVLDEALLKFEGHPVSRNFVFDLYLGRVIQIGWLLLQVSHRSKVPNTQHYGRPGRGQRLCRHTPEASRPLGKCTCRYRPPVELVYV